MNKILVAIVSIAVLACIVIAAAVYINPNNTGASTDTTSIGTIPINNIKADRGPLQAELKNNIPAITNSAMVYEVNKPVIDKAYIKHLTDQFSMNSNAPSGIGPSGETFIDDGDKRIEMFKDGGFYYRISSKVLSNNKPNNLPSKDQSIEIAEKFFKDNKLFHANPDSVSVTPIYTQKYDSNNKTYVKDYTTQWCVHFDPLINGCKIVGPGDHLGAYVGDNGEITLANVIWREPIDYKKVNLKSMDKALSDLTRGNGNISTLSDNGNKVVITNASIGYYMESGLDEQKYIEPVYVFDGDMYNGNTLVQAGGFSAYVPALENESELS